MPIFATLRRNLYKDSVALMRIAEQVLSRSGAHRATLVMGTPANKEILAEAKLLVSEVQAAGPSDLVIVIDGDSAQIEAARHEIDVLLTERGPAAHADGAKRIPPTSIRMGLGEAKDACLAQISVPGPYAAAEAMKALKAGLHVFLFSDNVPLSEELVIKALAKRKGLLAMGPDCGTAIIAGVPLGFANVVRRGRIGLVAASGTGLQEISTQIHRMGEGISHAIGTGGRDVSAEVGGVTMLQGLELLARDAATEVIVIVSKPPAEGVTREVLAGARSARKPVVVLFLGASVAESGNIHPAATLFEAASSAVRLCNVQPRPVGFATDTIARVESAKLSAGQQFVRALYSGGTFCAEAQVIWGTQGLQSWSNVPLDKSRTLADPRISEAHTVLDLGDDAFTVGKPHPMIDPSTRIERLLVEAANPAVAVILMDVVLGYGSHDDMAGALAPAIQSARALAAREGRHLTIVSFVCGTEDDPQQLAVQQQTLRDAGALVAPSSTAAARLAGAIVAGR